MTKKQNITGFEATWSRCSLSKLKHISSCYTFHALSVWLNKTKLKGQHSCVVSKYNKEECGELQAHFGISRGKAYTHRNAWLRTLVQVKFPSQLQLVAGGNSMLSIELHTHVWTSDTTLWVYTWWKEIYLSPTTWNIHWNQQKFRLVVVSYYNINS